MIKASVIGATGYAGVELVRLLAGHPDVEIAYLSSQSHEGEEISDLYPSLKGTLEKKLAALDVETYAKESDVIFTSLPHGASGTVIPALYDAGASIIDLSGDFRYDDVQVYEKWYGTTHARSGTKLKSGRPGSSATPAATLPARSLPPRRCWTRGWSKRKTSSSTQNPV